MDPLLTQLKKKSLDKKEYSFISGKEHTPTDSYCASNNVFIIENLCNLGLILGNSIINTYPMNYVGLTGLPCRVVAEK